jgi:hypothetical protein
LTGSGAAAGKLASTGRFAAAGVDPARLGDDPGAGVAFATAGRGLGGTGPGAGHPSHAASTSTASSAPTSSHGRRDRRVGPSTR